MKKSYANCFWPNTGCGGRPGASKTINFHDFWPKSMKINENQWKSWFFMKIDDFHDRTRLLTRVIIKDFYIVNSLYNKCITNFGRRPKCDLLYSEFMYNKNFVIQWIHYITAKMAPQAPFFVKFGRFELLYSEFGKVI